MSGEKILLVEDEPKLLRLLQDEVLPSHGFRVVTAATGREGLDKLASEEPDLLLIDLQLPDGAATELVKATRRDTPGIPCRTPGALRLRASSSQTPSPRSKRLHRRAVERYRAARSPRDELDRN